MLVVGLTGSMAMGKSETARMFAAEGVPVFDADAHVHQMYQRGGEGVEIVRSLCPEAIVDDAVDRGQLAVAIRETPMLLKQLEDAIHPLVHDKLKQFLTTMKNNRTLIVVLDSPLLFETGQATEVDKVVVVTAPQELQIKRIMNRTGMSMPLARTLISNQMPHEEKVKRADFIVDTGKGLDFARTQVRAILRQLETASRM